MKTRRGARALSARFTNSFVSSAAGSQGKPATSDIRREAIHPIVRTPPLSGRKALLARHLTSVATLALGLGMAAAPAGAQSVTTTGDVVPGGAASPVWNVGGNLYIGDTGAGALAVGTGGSVSSVNGWIGNAAGATGKVTVQGGGTWTNSGYLTVGSEGDGTLTIAGGGRVENTSGSIGWSSVSTGAVTVSGTGSIWANSSDLAVGASGNGSLTITAGGRVENARLARLGDGFAGSGTGVVTVSGSGSTWINSGNLSIGGRGHGTLLITGGGRVENLKTYWGELSGATAAATVSGLGSIWTINGEAAIGYGGAGTLTVADGGLVTADTMMLTVLNTGSGTINIGAAAGDPAVAAGTLAVPDIQFGAGTAALNFNHSGATTFAAALASTGAGAHALNHYAGVTTLTGDSSGFTGITTVDGGTLAIASGGKLGGSFGYVGSAAGSNGAVRVSGAGSLWASSGNLYVGHDGSGTLAITDGGGVENPEGYIANKSGSTGAVTVSGANSVWANSGFMVVGSEGNGTLSIEAGGRVENRWGDIGSEIGSTGTVTVSGAGSVWTNSGDLFVGAAGNGSLTISAGGRVENIVAGHVGRYSGSTGAATVSGAGSVWANSGFMYVGSSGSGTLAVMGGGRVENTGGYIGQRLGSTGTATVSGAGSTWVNSGSLLVGDGGDGTLNVEAGGTVSSIDAVVGHSAGSTGTVTVSGAGSIWTNSSHIVIGDDGTGTLNVEAGGTVSNTTSYVGSSTGTGTVTVSGAGSVWTNSGDVYVGDGGHGTLNVADGGKVNSWIGHVGYFTNSTGAVTVSGAGSIWANASDLRVGDRGHGTLAVEAGGRVENTNGLIGAIVGSTGAVTVSGRDSTWANSSDLVVGDAGSGTLTVADGGLAAASAMTLAKLDSSIGTINIGGAVGDPLRAAGTLDGATLAFGVGTATLNFNHSGATTFTAALISTGAGTHALNHYAGTTTLTGDSSGFKGITTVEGGTLAITSGGKLGGAVYTYVGSAPGSDGTAIVSGPGSLWGGVDAVALYVGEYGKGTLTVAEGGRIENRYTFLSSNEGSTAAVTITGPNSIMHSRNMLFFGGGIGSLLIENGGQMLTNQSFLGWNDHANVTVTVSGPGSVLTNTSVLFMAGGDASTATLTIADGGLVVAKNVWIVSGSASSATINIGGVPGDPLRAAGTLDAATVEFRNGAGTLNFNHSGTTTFTAALTSTSAGAHTLDHYAGTTTLTGDSSGFRGTTTVSGGSLVVANALGGSALVSGGSLVVDGAFGGSVDARTGGVVSGMGTIAGNADLTGGGVLAGASGQTLRIGGNAAMDTSSVVNVALGGPSATALFDVGGNLTLDGTLNVADAGGFGPGVYRIFDYGGALTDNGIAIGSTPAGVGASDLFVQTSVGHQVNLISTAGTVLGFWDGGNAALHDNGVVDGGAGGWRADGRNWTGADGGFNGPFKPIPTFAVFHGTGGVVTVDGSAGAIGVTGMQFAADGYRVEGDAIALQDAGGATVIRVGDGTLAGAGMTATIASALTGSSTLVKSDHGTLVLSGLNSFAGGVRLDAGTLSVSSDANLGAASGSLAFDGGGLATTASFGSSRSVTLDAAGRLDVAADTTLGLSGAISGAGDLVKQGGGTLVLTGTSAYGNTQVEAGTLVGNATSISGNVANAATVVFDQGSDASFAGTIAGLSGVNGAMVKRGAGHLSLVGVSVLDWTVEAGGLRADAGRFSGNAALSTGTTLTFDQAAAASYGGVLSGSGAFTVAGGAVTLTGNSSAFTGTTTVAAGGELIVGTLAGGALGGSITIGGGSLLGGTGTIGSAGSTVTIAAGGVHAPGNSIGVQLIAGNYVNHGTLRIEATPAKADRIVVAGSVDITGATLDLVLSPTDAASWNVFNGPYVIIDKQSAGAVAGTFAQPHTQNLLFLDALVAYDGGNGNDVTLALVRNDLAFAGVGRTPNQIATAKAVDTLGNTHPVWRSIALTNDQGIVRASFDALSGEIHGSTQTAMIEDSRFVRNAVNDRIRAAFDGVGASRSPVVVYENGIPRTVAATTDRFAVWGQGFGSWGHTSGAGNAARLNRSTGGFFIGADAAMFDTWRFGAIAGYSRTNFDVKNRHASSTSDNYHVGLYGGTQWGALAFRTGAAYTWHDVGTTRSVVIPGIAERLSAGYRAGTFQAFGELGYGFEMGATRFEPFANLAHVSLRTDGFGETGGNAALTGAGTTTDVTFTTLGLRVEHGVTLGTVDATLKGMAGWRHAFGDTTPSSTHSFSAGNAFSIAGVPIARNAAIIEAGLDLRLSPDATFGMSYSGQFGSGTQDHGFKANLNVRF